MVQCPKQRTTDDLLEQGNARLAGNDYSGAIEVYHYVLAIDPRLAEAFYNCGVAFHKQGNLNQAIEHYNRALRLRPDLAQAYFNMAHAYAELNRFKKAEAAYRQTLRVQPDNAQAAYNLGLLYKAQALFDKAVDAFQHALRIRPDYAEAFNNIGVIWRDKDQLDPALLCFEQALAIKPRMVEALYNIGVTHQKLGQFDQAIDMYQRALDINPCYAPARWLHLLALPMLYAHEAQIDDYRERFAGNLAHLIHATPLGSDLERKHALEGIASTTNFYLQYQGRDDLDLQKQYGRFVVQVMAANFPCWSKVKPMPTLPSGEKIRIGYASSCMYGHTIGVFLMGWLQDRNHDDFDVFCYHLGDRTDALTEKIRATADHYHHFPGNITAAAAQIERDQLHILVHTDIGMHPVTLQLAALRLAPVQCKGWGHPVTTGLPTIDYYLTSDLMERSDAQRYYSEKLIRLPNLALNYTPPILPAAPKSRTQLGLPEDAVIYLTTQSLFKYLPQHDDIYSLIAAQVPQAVFVFLSHGNAKVTELFARRLRSAFEARGVAFNCLFIPRLKHEDFLSLNITADVLLDTLEWSGGKTSLEALSCDLPVVTLPGAFMRGRHSYAFLTRMGLADTIAVDKADYIAKAIRLGQEPSYRHQLKNYINKHKILLYNDKNVNKTLENFFRQALIPLPRPNAEASRTVGTDPPGDPLHSVGSVPVADSAASEQLMALWAEGNQFQAQRQWANAAVCYERALAHIPKLLGLNHWYQRYLLDGQVPPDCSSDFMARIYARLAQCQLEQGHIDAGRSLSLAALRIDAECKEARELHKIVASAIDREPSQDHQAATDAMVCCLKTEQLADRLSILVVSSFTRKVVRYKHLAPPSDGLVKATFASALQNLAPWLTKCKKHLCYDRPQKRSAEDRRYEETLTRFCQEFGFTFHSFDWAGLQSVVRHMVPCIDTPYLLFLEHDWFFNALNIDLGRIIACFETHPELNYIRFNKRPNIISNLDFLLYPEQRWREPQLLRTPSYSNNPHIIRVSTLRDQWLPICLADSICREKELRGTVFGTEEVLFKHYMRDVRRWGFEQAHARWGAYIFGPLEAKAAVVHLGE